MPKTVDGHGTTLVEYASRGGPKTDEGKAITRLNARKHGILSTIIPPHELPAYSIHIQHVRDHYKPQGYVESVLVDRVGNILWRIARVARFEQATITRAIETGIHRGGMGSLEELTASVVEALSQADDELAQTWAEDAMSMLENATALASVPHEVVAKVPRYEAHLDRSLKRTLDQLRDEQRHRQ